ncbi:uncharacterized protein F4822DRAFT_440627 [Hypoxylon trugodes]|uniref:uncharacterized protein n=1 Tax=Hypoxylon trugodes TaxID=326681 RepID=UPI0021A1C602|nr:uncharacterized protein F4822DRAFT_440627 [Hypoxylon trugodes]KAI1383627.1 hypothetical protein F4822DRAFT_440627 [Hypoxylon trugodes]
MGSFAKMIVVGLMALCLGIVSFVEASVVNGLPRLIEGDSGNATAIVTSADPTAVFINPPNRLSGTHHPSTFTTIYLTDHDHSASTSPPTTDTGGSLLQPPSTSFGRSPIMTEVPKRTLKFSEFFDLGEQHHEGSGLNSRDLEVDDGELVARDDYDGYGYAHGPSTAPVVVGGYGSPPVPTGLLPPGGYGVPAAPEIVDPSVVTLPDPPTVTVSLSLQTPPFAIQSTPAIPHVVTITKIASSASVASISQVPPQNVTKTVTAPKSVSAPVVVVITTPPVKAGTTTKTDDYVYTTVSVASSASHASSSNFVVLETPIAHPSPRPSVVETNAADFAAKFNLRLMLVAAALAVMGCLMLS